MEIATVHKMRPRTKHINIKYHHFREYVRLKKITIQSNLRTTTLMDLQDLYQWSYFELITTLFKDGSEGDYDENKSKSSHMKECGFMRKLIA